MPFHFVLSCFQGKLTPNATTFPSGIKALADYVHARGLYLGIYADSGCVLYNCTCTRKSAFTV